MPQPIDMQSEISRVSMAERIQEASTRSSLAAQQRAALDTEQNDQLKEVQVNQTEQAENPEVESEGRRKNPYAGRRKKRKPSPDDERTHTVYNSHEAKEVLDDPDAHGLDITV